jgi:putative oxidoreductase
MIGAIVTAKLSKGFIGGYEFELLLISICLTLVILGPGKISIENYFLKREIFPKGKQLYQKTTNTEINSCYEIYLDFITYLFMGKTR